MVLSYIFLSVVSIVMWITIGESLKLRIVLLNTQISDYWNRTESHKNELLYQEAYVKCGLLAGLH